MDLVEAEGIGDLIHARTAAQKRQALGHMTGVASQDYERWREDADRLPGAGRSIGRFQSRKRILRRVRCVGVRDKLILLRNEISSAIIDADRGRAIREGVKVVFAGAPNTGKSSLLNRIARREAAIVSPIAGTTRDVIEVPLDLGGIPVILTDTAGLRTGSADQIEQIGMARAEAEILAADLTIWVTSPDIADHKTRQRFDSDTIRVLNKCDLVPESSHNRNESSGWPVLPCVGPNRRGYPGIAGQPSRRRFGTALGPGEAPVAVRARHLQALKRCATHLTGAIDSPAERIGSHR